MKDWHLILGRARQLVRGGDDNAAAISAALAERRYTYGHPADYLRVALKIDAHLRHMASMPRLGVQPPPGYRPALPPPRPPLPPAPPDIGRAAIRAVVYADRFVPAKNAAPRSTPARALGARIIRPAATALLSPEDHAMIRPDLVSPGQQQGIATSIERMAWALAPALPASQRERLRLTTINRRRL